MRKVISAGFLGLFFFLFYTSQVWADLHDSFDAMRVISGQPNNVDMNKDIDEDGKVGLPEAIYPLQVLSFVREMPHTCGAYVAPGMWKEFDCYNLAAVGKDLHHNPFTPSWSLIGGYWQWGRKGPDPSLWHTNNTPHFAHGSTGPDIGDANEDKMSSWDETNAPDGAWTDSHKTADDPCPDGFRVPSQSQWDGVRDNNTQSAVGTWSSKVTNYSSAMYFGRDLMLPAAGYRNYSGSGALVGRGGSGSYWSSSETPDGSAWLLYFYSGGVDANINDRRNGFSVRCVKDSSLSNLSMVATTLLPSPAIDPVTQKVDYGATIRFGAIVWVDDRNVKGGGTITREDINASFKAYLTDPVDDKSGEYDNLQEAFEHPGSTFGHGPENIDGRLIPPVLLKDGAATAGLGDWGYFGDNDAFSPHPWGVQGIGDYLRTQDLPDDLDSATVTAFQNDIIPALRDLMARRNNWLHPTEAIIVNYEHTGLGMTFTFFLYTYEIVATAPGLWQAEFMVDGLNLINEQTRSDNYRAWEFAVEDRGVLYELSEFYGSENELAEWPDTNLACEPAPGEDAPVRYRVKRIRVRHGGGETSGYHAFKNAGVNKQARRKTKIDEFWGPYATGKFSMDGTNFEEYAIADPNQVRYVFMMATGQDAGGESTTTGQEEDSAKGYDKAKWVELLTPSLPTELARLHHQYGYDIPFNPENTLIFTLPKHYYYLYQASAYKTDYVNGLIEFMKVRTGNFNQVKSIFMAGRSRGGALCLALAKRLKDLRTSYPGLADSVIMPIGVDAYSDYMDPGAAGHGTVAANADSFGNGKAYKGRKHNLASLFGSDDRIFVRINHGHYKKESNVFDCGSDCSKRKYQIANEFGDRENIALCNGGRLCHDELDPYTDPSDLVPDDQVTQVAYTRKHYGFDSNYDTINQGKNLEYFFQFALDTPWPDSGTAGCEACSTSQWYVRNWPNPETTSHYDNVSNVAMIGQEFSVDRAMKISHVSLKVTHNSGTNSYRVSVYADCGGQPCLTELGRSAWQTISTADGAWTNFAIQGAPLLSTLDFTPFRYWLVFESQNSDAGGVYAHGTAGSTRHVPGHGTLFKPDGIDWTPRSEREDLSFVIHECAN